MTESAQVERRTLEIEKHITSLGETRGDNVPCCQLVSLNWHQDAEDSFTCTMKEEEEQRNPGHGEDTTELC